MDSNSRYINFRKLWTLKNTDIQRCGTIAEVSKLVDRTEYTNIKYFFFSVGCNDVEYKDGDGVFADIKILVEKITSKYDNVKVILSEITPRMDEFDENVKDCNKLLHEYTKENQNLFLTRNSNLRDPIFFLEDGKHLKRNASARFASNIKGALRRAYGIRRFDNFSGKQNNFDGQPNNWRRNYSENRLPDNFDRQRLWNPVPRPSSEELAEILRNFAMSQSRYHGSNNV